MSELTIEQLIKIVIAVFVIVMVVLGVYIFFKGSVMDFFKNIGPGNYSGVILPLLK